MEEVERTNVVVVRNPLQRQEGIKRDSFAIEMDRERNCYSCGGFGHIM